MLKALTLLALLALVSCSSKPTPTSTSADTEPVATSPPTIIGTWQWAETISAWWPDTTTPAECGCTQGLRFTEAGTFERLQNDTVVASGTYQILYVAAEPSTNPPEPHAIVFNNRSQIPIVLTDTTLVFDSRAWDGPREKFIR